MSKAIVTGSYGLIGSHVAKFLDALGFAVMGIDNESREAFFECSERTPTKRMLGGLKQYKHLSSSILDMGSVELAFREHKPDFVVHCAGQPSHDWAADNPEEDFECNARGTLNMLMAAKKHAPDCVFVLTSTNKVYGDRPNTITKYRELETRWEPEDEKYAMSGFDENMSVDQCKHSMFGVSKLYADMVAQEYGRYFGMKTGVFRLGCVTGPMHSGVEQHGFMSYLMRCLNEGRTYRVYGHKGKQVRDNIHAFDVATAFYEFYKNPGFGEVYNLGGGQKNNCSVLEAIKKMESLTGKEMSVRYEEEPRKGDHIWYVSDTAKFKSHYPGWKQDYTMSTIIEDMMERTNA